MLGEWQSGDLERSKTPFFAASFMDVEVDKVSVKGELKRQEGIEVGVWLGELKDAD